MKFINRYTVGVASLGFLALASCGDSESALPSEVVSLSEGDSTFSIGTPLPALVSAATPNEPAGYIRFAENDLKTLPGGLWQRTSLLGHWSNFPLGDPDLTIGTTSNGPKSPSPFLSTRFPTGLVAGRGPVNFGGWDAKKAYKSKFYTSIWIRIRGSSYENQATGTKLGFISYGEDQTSTMNQASLMLNGRNGQGVFSAFTLRFIQQKHVASNRRQNVDLRPLITAGPWHQIETVYEVNSIGQANGKLWMWVDGIQIMNYNDMVYITSAKPVKFNYWKWSPTWGGMGGVRTRTDYIDIDHVYMSGLP